MPFKVIQYNSRSYLPFCLQAMTDADDQVRIVDTETTGKNKDRRDQPVQLAICNVKGDVLYNKYLKPTIPVCKEAYEIHRISEAMVADAPTMTDEYEEICKLIDGKVLIAYGARFDSAILENAFLAYKLNPLNLTWHCALVGYANYWNAPPRWPGANPGFQSLKDACKQQGVLVADDDLHDALADVRATISLMGSIAKRGRSSPTYYSTMMNDAAEEVAQ